MNTTISELVARITELEAQLERALADEMDAKRRQFLYAIDQGKIAFQQEARELHKTFRQSIPAFLREAPIKTILVSPVIYSVFLPLVLLDAWFWFYQTICFPAFGIAKVDRSRYILLDRSKLPYLNAIERFNCDYCSYANGLIGYAREIAARTEQYFCPIKHAHRRAGAHSRYRDFFDYGDARAYRTELIKLRDELKP